MNHASFEKLAVSYYIASNSYLLPSTKCIPTLTNFHNFPRPCKLLYKPYHTVQTSISVAPVSSEHMSGP